MTFEEELNLKTEGVEEIILKYLPAEEGFQRTVLEAMNYSVKAGGKRLRPLLMQETYAMFDGHGKVIEPFLAAIEFIHSASLIHDDLPCMDNDTLRRGKPSTWAAYGEAMGVLSGDALLLYAFETAAKAFGYHANLNNVGRAVGILAEKSGINGMIGGQTVDVEMTGKPLSEDQLDYIFENKTGALIEAAMMCGAVLADASNEDVRVICEIASEIGYAFQIEDDLLDIRSTDEELGKTAGSDERNEKTTYVTLYGAEAAERKVQELTENAVRLLDSLAGENRFLRTLLMSLTERNR